MVGWDGMHCWTSLLQAWSLWCCVVGFLFDIPLVGLDLLVFIIFPLF